MNANDTVRLGCLFISALLVGGCDLDGEVRGEPEPEDEDEVVEQGGHGQGVGAVDVLAGAVEAEAAWLPINPPVDPRNVCFSQGRLPVIARSNLAQPCDFTGMPEGWTAVSLASKLPPALIANLQPYDPYLRYCEYTLDQAIPDDQAGAKYDELVWAMDVADSIDDPRNAGMACLTAMPMSGGLGDDPTLEASFAEIFMASVGRADPELLAEAVGGDVNIFLVDNWAGDGTLVAQDDHGQSLARILERLTAGAGNIDIVPIVGLPRMDGDVGTVLPGGGVKGTAPDLSVAFMTAAMLHIEDNAGGVTTRSIVNASVGGPALDEGQMASDATWALIDATRTLACLGVQVNFAAGNELPTEGICGFEPEGLLFPGDLDGAFPAPTKAECLAMGYIPTEPDSFYAYGSWQPSAISGVDALDQPLPNGRLDGSRTKIAANGLAAHTDAGDSFMLTGTSVSTAVMSAASALKWWLDPELGPLEVTMAVADAGAPLSWDADAGAFAGTVAQRIDICATISGDLQGQDIKVECPTPDLDYGGIGIEVEALAAVIEGEGGLFASEVVTGTAPLCDGPDDYDMTDAMINPAPTRPACDNCTAGKDVKGQSGHNTAFLGMTMAPWSTQLAVEHAYLIAYDSARSPTMFTLDATVVAAMNDPQINMTTVDFYFPDLSSAALQLNYDDGVTMTLTALPVW